MITLYRHVWKKPASATSSKSKPNPPCVHRAQDQQQLREDGPVVRPLSQPSRPQGVAAFHHPGPDEENPVTHALSGGKCDTCREERRAASNYRWRLILALMLPFALQALDATIIASALPWIADDFGEVSQLNWIISAFNLPSASFIPFWGQMADIFGRHMSIQVCILIMMVGSALCVAAPNYAYPVLLLGRGCQGLGCAGISLIVRIILADKVSLKENAKNWSIFSFTAGISYGLGPVIGGYLTSANWRWCFGINLPICAIAIPLVVFVIRKELLGPQPIPGLDGPGDEVPVGVAAARDTTGTGAGIGAASNNPGSTRSLATFSRRLTTIDAGGQVLFLLGFGLLILGLTWSGATYEWSSAPVLTALVVGAVLVAGFVYWEKQMAPGNALALRWPHQKPMVHWKLITNRDLGLLSYINFATGAAMYAVLYFCNIYYTVVKQHSAHEAGVQLLFYTPGLGVGVYLSVILCNTYPRNTFAPLMLGSVIEAVGIGVLAWALYHEHSPTIFGMMALTGAGTGLRFMPGSLHAIGFFPDLVASVISLMAVMQPFGGTLALTIMSTVYNNASGFGRDPRAHDLERLRNMTEPGKTIALQHAKMGIVWAFVSITPIMLLCIAAALCLGNVNITHEMKSEGDEGYGDNVNNGVYLLDLFRRWRRTRGENRPRPADDEEENLKTLNAKEPVISQAS